jgi:pre-rRNA-processing protein TSR2
MASLSSSPSVASPQATLIFARGVIARLALWPVLRAAVDNAWGGTSSAQKRTWLASEIVDAFESSLSSKSAEEPDEDYVTIMILQVRYFSSNLKKSD